MSDDDQMSVTSFQTEATNPDSTFRSPNISSRGRKRKPVYHDDGSEVSFLPSPKRVRGKPPTTPRVKGAPKVGRATPAKKLANIDESSLFNVVKAGKGFEQCINSWINSYKAHHTTGISKIQQLFLHSCGCRGIFKMMPDIDYALVIRNMSDEFDEDCAEYPIIQSGPQWKKFRTNFENFLKLLIKKLQGEIIFDNYFMDNVVRFLTGLADSHIRAFRHTATFAAMKISTALVDLVVKMVELRDKTDTQIETEKRKLRQRGTNEQLELLLQTKAEHESKISDLSDMAEFLFKSVFVHRYRDVVSDIRSICITELGNWMNAHPAYFLDDSYLKYVGWLLYDKQPEVRLQCIMSLHPLFEAFNHVKKLEIFLSRFKDRLLKMIADKDLDVAIKTCQLLTSIFKAFPDMLTPDECGPIYEQVYTTNRQLAVASGEFLCAKFFEGARENQTKELLGDLIIFYIQSEVHTHAAYLIDALIETTPIVKDWATMASMLLSDECDQYDSYLVEILVAAIKQASTGDPPTGRSAGRRPAKDLKIIQEDRTKISEVLIPNLPKLINRHIADRDKIANLTTIPQFFILELYPTGRMMKYLDELFIALQRVVEQYADDEILSNVAICFSAFHSNIAVDQHTISARSQLFDELAISLRTSLQQFQTEQSLDEEDETLVLNRFRKMNAFAATEDLRRNDLWDLTIHLLNNTYRINNPHIADKAVINAFLTLSWDIQRLFKHLETNVREAARKLLSRRDQFLGAVRHLLTSGATGVENAFLCLCDLLILLNWKVAADYNDSEITDLEITLDNDFNKRINDFVVDNVFVSEEHDPMKSLDQYQQIELLAKRRNLLSQFCKLIMHGVLPISDAALVLRYYLKYNNDFGDILKALMNKCREVDRIATAQAISAALTHSFDGLLTASKGNIDPVDEDFTALRDLAKKFAMSFGPDASRNREAIATIHKLGIAHSLKTETKRRKSKGEQQHIAYLEVLIEFSPRLLRQDKQAVLRYLEKNCPVSDDILANDDSWQPYLLYRASLQEKHTQAAADDAGSIRSFAPPAGRGRGGRARRRVNSTPTPSEFSMA